MQLGLDVILPGVVVVLIELGEGWSGWSVGLVCRHDEGGREGKDDGEGLWSDGERCETTRSDCTTALVQIAGV